MKKRVINFIYIRIIYIYIYIYCHSLLIEEIDLRLYEISLISKVSSHGIVNCDEFHVRLLKSVPKHTDVNTIYFISYNKMPYETN